MPLRDHFHPPTSLRSSWEEVHGAWPTWISARLNELLPPEFRSGVRVHLGRLAELGVSTFEEDDPSEVGGGGGTALAWAPAAPAVLLDTETPDPPEYEVRVYDERRMRRLVAVVEIVSPSNKYRAEHRDTFVAKCHALLHQGVCVAVVDPVTERGANLYAELAERMGADPPVLAAASLYAVCLRRRLDGERFRLEAWEHELAVGAALPTLPLWYMENRYVPLELEPTYEATCRGLRIP
jgi:hypothetical protein